jgi:hypothetical protein
MMASNPPSGASRLPETWARFTSLAKLEVSVLQKKKEKICKFTY